MPPNTPSQVPEINENRAITPASSPDAQKSELILRQRSCLKPLALCLAAALLPSCDIPNPLQDDAGAKHDAKPAEKEVPEIKERKFEINHPKYGKVYAWHPSFRGELDDIVIHFHGYDREEELKWSQKAGRWLAEKLDKLRNRKKRGKKSKKKDTGKPKQWTVKDFWEKRDLEGQFRSTGLKKLFIVPRSARDGKEPVQKDVVGLLEFVQSETGINTTNKNITVTAHSGGGFTVRHWLNDPRVNNVIMYDALYYESLGEPVPKQLKEWLETEGNRLLMVSIPKSSLARHRKFVKQFNAPEIREIPNQPSPELCKAKVVHYASKESHGGLISGKETIRRALKFEEYCRRFR